MFFNQPHSIKLDFDYTLIKIFSFFYLILTPNKKFLGCNGLVFGLKEHLQREGFTWKEKLTAVSVMEKHKGWS